MNLSKLISLCAAFLLLCSTIGAQDNELEFKIVKLKEARLYPDSICILKRDDTLRLVLRGDFSVADVTSVRFNMGTAAISDSQIIVRVTRVPMRPLPGLRLTGNRSGDTAALSSYVDSAIVQVHLNPKLHTPDTVLEKVVYILPGPPPLPVMPYVYRKTGFYVRWNKKVLETQKYVRKGLYTLVTHHVPKERLLKEMESEFKYQNYSSADTTVKKFDSLYALIVTPKKNYRFHLNGSAATPEMIEAIERMRTGDRMRLRLFWNKGGEEKRVTTFFRISAISYIESGFVW